MLDLTKPHNWLALAAAIIVVTFVLAQIGKRVKPVDQLNRMSWQAA